MVWRRRIANAITFRLELFILRGPLYRLLIVALLVVLIALGAGLLVFALGASFASSEDAVWWAFLRLTDPGYLGDDQGVLLRSVSTVVTVLGYVIFLGALVAIMTQWFQQRMNQLQAGLTPIVERQHIVVLGWTNRTETIIHELFSAEGPVRRFLARFGRRRLRVVLLSDRNPGDVAPELADHLGHLWERTRLIIRSGSPLLREHLDRVDFLRASVLLLPASESSASTTSLVDGAVIKTLITISNTAAERQQPLPFVVAEVLDGHKAPLARRAYGGPIEVVASDLLMGRLIAQNLRHPGLSVVCSELLGHEHGNEVYVRDVDPLADRTFGELDALFPHAIPIGVLRRAETSTSTLLNPSLSLRLEKLDRLVLIAEDYERSGPQPSAASAGLPSASKQPPSPASENANSQGSTGQGPPSHRTRASKGSSSPPRSAAPAKKKILILGWNHRTPTLLEELGRQSAHEYEVSILSRTEPADRHELMKRMEMQTFDLKIRHLEGDFTSATELSALKPQRYDTILLLASNWTDEDASTDARTIVGYWQLAELLEGCTRRPRLLVELLNQDNASLFAKQPAEVFIGPKLISHLLTQVALRREIHGVFDTLLGAQGAEIATIPAASLELLAPQFSEPKPAGSASVQWSDISQACRQRGHIALGVRYPGIFGEQSIRLNPAKSSEWTFSDTDELIVLRGGG